MVHVFKRDYTYKQPFSLVTQAFWRKYPNPEYPNVLDVDVIDRRVDPETGKLITRRLITAKSNIPSVIQPFVGKLNDFRCYMLEDTVIDPKTETLEMHTRTISYTNLMQVDEHVTYKGVPLDDGNDRTNKGTYYTQEANISVTLKGPGMGFISNKAEGIIHSSYYKNSNKGVALLERLCREISSPSSSSTTADEEITPSSSSSPATIVDHHQHAPAH